MMCPLIADEKKDAEAQTRRERSQALVAGRAGGERESKGNVEAARGDAATKRLLVAL